MTAPTDIIWLEFDPKLNRLDQDKKLSDGLSAVVQVGTTLWVANDESIGLERLTLVKPGSEGVYQFGREHKSFSLSDFLDLPVPPGSDPEDEAEADIEGLAFEDGYFWLVGSHSLKRKKPDPGKGSEKARKRLAKIESDGNRFLLARIPVRESGGTFQLTKKTEEDGKKRTAARLPGDAKGNELVDVLRKDEHLEPFFALPGKDNGFDIEGLIAVNTRLFIGLRGPVLRGWTMILEVEPKADESDPTFLKLTPIEPDGRPYRKHFLELDGLGVRDLCVQGDDLMILAGPTMDLDGPVAVFRWRGGADRNRGEAVVPSSELDRLLEIPYGQGGDHAEGMALLTPPGGGNPDSLLVVYDAATLARRYGENALAADVFRIP